MALSQSAPEEQDVYSLTPLSLCAPSERNVVFNLHSAPDGAGMVPHEIRSYKHVAPPEQEPSNQ